MSNVPRSVQRFKQLAAEERFQGWPLVGEPQLGEKIPFFGQSLHYQLKTGSGVEDYTSIIRHFGWAVVFGVIELYGRPHVITLVQWKPGVNCASWELPPGGIGKVAPNVSQEDILAQTQAVYQKETGFGNGTFTYLGHTMIETGKFRGAGPDDHGLPAHLYLATDLQQLAPTPFPHPNEIMTTLFVPLDEFREVLDSGCFTETSAVACAYKALVSLGKLRWS
jgi:hypothetical protein